MSASADAMPASAFVIFSCAVNLSCSPCCLSASACCACSLACVEVELKVSKPAFSLSTSPARAFVTEVSSTTPCASEVAPDAASIALVMNSLTPETLELTPDKNDIFSTFYILHYIYIKYILNIHIQILLVLLHLFTKKTSKQKAAIYAALQHIIYFIIYRICLLQM